jgi:membrane-associated protease RseP (regulator of RpoE activity)
MELSPKKILIHSGLFVLTFVTTTLAGAEWVYSRSIVMTPDFGWNDFVSGMPYSVPFLLILTVHEFGHYFTAIHYKVRTSLPYYIPLPPIPLMFGTLGALIRLKSRVYSKQQNFDIGIAGPLAGFIVTIGVLWYGFSTLPPPEYIFQFHPEYKEFGLGYANSVYDAAFLKEGVVDVIIGKNLIFLFFENFVADPARIPNVHEIIHYPYLFAGFLALVFTSINLLPIGQLDGGHVLYGLLGFRGHRLVASGAFVLFLFYAGLGVVRQGTTFEFMGIGIPHTITVLLFIGFLYACLRGLRVGWQNQLMITLIVFAAQYFLVLFFPKINGYSGWLLFAFLIGRFIGVLHPPSEIEAPISTGRKVFGWIALLIFVISFSPAPIDLILITRPAP